MSADPALEKFLPKSKEANEDEEDDFNPWENSIKRIENLPGYGGIYNFSNLNLYCQTNNNPIKYFDPDGKWINIVIGAAIGSAISAGISVASQLVTTGKVDVTTTLIAAGSGAISGGLAATGVGLIGQIIGNSLIAGGQDIVGQIVDNKGDISKTDFAKLGVSIAVGAFSGLLGGKGADNGNMKALSNQLGKRIGDALAYKTGNELKKEISKALVHFMKSSGTTLKQVNKEVLKSILRSNIPAIYKLGKDAYDGIIKDIEKEMK